MSTGSADALADIAKYPSSLGSRLAMVVRLSWNE
jgi:hypothetical protein